MLLRSINYLLNLSLNIQSTLCNLKSQIIPGILSTISRKLQNQSRPLFYFCQPHSSILNTISRGSHFANYFRIIKSLQSICTTTSKLFIKKGVQKLAAFNASTSSSSGACPSVWAASDQQTNTEQSAKPPIKWHLLRQQFLRNLSRNNFNPYAHLTQILTIHSVQVF